MLHALFAAGIHPDVIVGTSVGAFNGAWVAGRGPEADLEPVAGSDQPVAGIGIEQPTKH